MRNHTLSSALLPLTLPTVLLGLSLTSCAAAQEQEGRGPTHSFAYQSSDGEGRSVELRIENDRVVTAKVDGHSIPADRVRKVPDGYELLGPDGSVLKRVAVKQPGLGQQEGMRVVRGQNSSSGSSSSGSSSSSSNGRTRSESRATGSARGNARAEAGSSGGASGEQDGRRSEARSRARIAIGPDSREIEIREGELMEPAEVAGFAMDVAEAPRSMIGAGLGSPDAALAHHLKLDRARSTMITSIVEGLPAQAAGLEQFDVIVSVNGDRNASSDNLRRVLREAEPGSKIALEFVRGSETRKVEVAAVEFDGEKLDSLEPIEAQGFAIPPMDSFGGDEGGGGVMFFVGPDGQRREFRMPAMPAMPNGFDPQRMAEFERSMAGFNQRMDEWNRRMEQRMRERTGDGDIETDIEARPAPGAPRDARPRDNAGDERMRRLEERLDQLMRELERERAERREPKKDA